MQTFISFPKNQKFIYKLLNRFISKTGKIKISFIYLIDLDQPEKINKNILDWIDFINKEVALFLRENSSENISVARKFGKDFHNKNSILIEQHITTDKDTNNDESNNVFEFSLILPLIFLGIRNSQTVHLNSSELESVSYLLRSFSAKYGGALVYLNLGNQDSMKQFLEYISSVYFDALKQPKINDSYKELLLPVGYDKVNSVEKLLQFVSSNILGAEDSKEKKSQDKYQDEEDYITPENFLTNIQNRTYQFTNTRKEIMMDILQSKKKAGKTRQNSRDNRLG